MQIKIKSVSVENKGKYKVANVEYTDINKEKDGTKQVVSFGETSDVFTTLSGAKSGECYDITAKQSGQYWNWVSAVKIDGSPNPTRGFTPPARGNYETPEERASRQVYIIRQSSIANALTYFQVNGAKKVSEADVLRVAKTFEDFVFGRVESSQSAMSSIRELEDDIPL